MRAETFWYRTIDLAANAAEDGTSDPSDVDLPDGVVERLHATQDAHSAVVDEIIGHLRATGQAVPAIPTEGDS